MSILSRILKKYNVSENKEKIVRNLFWALTGKVVNMLGSLFVGIIVARYLGPDQYGLMSYVISFVTVFQVVAYFGLDSIQIREEAKDKEKKAVIIGTTFTLKLIFAACSFIILNIIVLCSESNSYIRLMILLYSFTIFFNTFIVIRNHFTSIVWNEYVVKSEISRTLLGAIFKITLLLLHASLTWFIFASFFDAVLLSSGYVLSYKNKIGKISSWKFDRSIAKFLIGQSFPLLLSGAAIVIYQRIDQVMIGNMIDKASVGYFSVASKFVELLIFIPTIMVQTVTPILVKAHENNYDEYVQKGQRFMNISVWISILAAIITSLLSYWIILITFGKQYFPAIAVLQILSFKAISAALSGTCGAMIVVEGLQKITFIRDIMGCFICILLNFLFLPKYGILAAAVVSITSNLVAGYLSGLFLPIYRHIFIRQTKALLLGWKDMLSVR